METLTFRKIEAKEIKRELFAKFERRQVVNLCYRREGDRWVKKADPFVDDWEEKDYEFLTECLQNTIRNGGVVFGCFFCGQLKGFASVEGAWIGEKERYMDLTSLHVSRELRGQGIGKRLFHLAAGWALAKGAQKLYISAHSAVETQAFYEAMGCVDAVEINRKHAETEPYDRQMEYVL